MALDRPETHPRTLHPETGRTSARKSQVNHAGNNTIFTMLVKVYHIGGLQLSIHQIRKMIIYNI